MNLIEFIPLISDGQDVIVIRRLDVDQEEYEIIGEYSSIDDIPIKYAHMRVNVVFGFNSDGYDGLEINIS